MFYVRNDEEFVVIKENCSPTKSISTKQTLNIAKSSSMKEGKEVNSLRKSFGNIDVPNFELISERKNNKNSRGLAVDKYTIDCDKKSPEVKDRILRKQILIEKSPFLKKSMDFSISVNCQKKISDKVLYAKMIERISKK